jgi:UDP-N-acetylmuramoyl-L-alanyl-D-glutamate--2,6-diaminopimelate ligase
VVNRDHGAWETLDPPRGRTLFFGTRPDAQLRARDVELLPSGSRFLLTHEGEEAPVSLPLLGGFNVENALAAAGVARVAGMSLEEIAAGLADSPQIPGRLEVVASDPFRVLVDFAHTPEALEKVMATLRPLVQGRLIVLFGAGGDRDRGKRAPMGRVVDAGADVAVVTSDNPRSEDPEAIIDDVLEGMGTIPFLRLADRREAVAAALEEAREGDVVLLAGKGHETYQVVGDERRPFPEAEIVRDLIAGRKGGGS